MKLERREFREHLDRVYASGEFPAAAFDSDLSARGVSESRTTYVVAPPLGRGELQQGVGVVSMEDLRNAVMVVGRDATEPIELSVRHDRDLQMARLHVDEVAPGREAWSAHVKKPKNLGTYLPADSAEGMRAEMERGTAVRLPEWMVEKARRVDAAFGHGKAQIAAKPGEVTLRIGDPFECPQTLPFPALHYQGPECEVHVRSGTLADVLASQPTGVGVELVLLDAKGDVGIEMPDASRVIGLFTDDGYLYGLTRMVAD